MSGSVRVHVEQSSYIFEKFGGVRLARRRSLRTPISFLVNGRGDRSWVVHCLHVKSVGGEGNSRVLLAWHAKTMRVGIAVFLSVYCG